MPLRFDDQHEIADITMGELAKLIGALERARTILGNMALENEGAFFNRWPICHEPLRADARGLLPVIDEVLRDYTTDAAKGPAGDAGQVGWMGGDFDR
jgi:hypothetical protein